MDELCHACAKKMGQSHSQNTSYADSIGGGGRNGYATGGVGVKITKKRSSFRSPFLRRKTKQPLSATFTAPIGNNVDALNINTATVEQLMTLPGITRQIAQQIFEHRKAIGGRFQRIDDLALVSGIGAEKLEKIRPDICIRRTKLASTSNLNTTTVNGHGMDSSISSRTESFDSIISEPVFLNGSNYNGSNNINSCSGKLVLNVNKATIFQLQQLHEMNQEIAANVVDYRLRKGSFKKLEDLLKVKGMNKIRLSAIMSYLTLNDSDLPVNQTNNSTGRPSKLTRNPSMMSAMTPSKQSRNYMINNSNGGNYTTTTTANNMASVRATTIQRKSLSLPIKMYLNNSNLIDDDYDTDNISDTPVNDIFELLGAYSHRPIVEDDYRFERNGFSTIRLTTWNLDRMCLNKSENLGVKEVICRTILENRLSILCLQEVLDPLALRAICDELNQPKLKRVKEWRENSKNWKYIYNRTCSDGYLNGLGFIYDNDFCQYIENKSLDITFNGVCSDADDELGSIDGATTRNDTIMPSCYLASFKLSDWTCSILNLYLRFFNLSKLNLIIDRINEQLVEHNLSLNQIFFICGDFSGIKFNINNFYKNINNISIEYHHGGSSDDAQQIKHTDETGDNRSNANGGGGGGRFTASADCDDDNSDNIKLIRKLNFFKLINKFNYNILCREEVPSNISKINSLLADNNCCNSNINCSTCNNNNNNNDNNSDDKKLTGHYGIIKKGLSHMAIPNGWTWGGSVSEFYPIWIEVYRRCSRNETFFESSTPIKSTMSTPANGVHSSNKGTTIITNGLYNLSVDNIVDNIKRNI